MPKPLTAITISKLKPKLKRREVPDGGCPGLKVVIFPTGKKSFVVRYRYGGVQKKLTLGSCLTERGVAESDTTPALDTPLSLAAAREMATKALREAKHGSDPAAAKQKRHQEQVAAESETLLAISEKYLRQEGKKLRTLNQRKADLKLVTDVLGRLPVADIKRSQFKHVLDVIAEKSEVRSDRVLTALKRLLNWYAVDSDDYVPVLVPVRRRTSITERARTRVLSDEELLAVWLAAEQDQGPYGAWIRFTLLTATRRDESGGLRRSELIDGGTCWFLPAARNKSKRDVLIPLSKAAQKIVKDLPVHAGDDPYVFSVDGTKPLGSFGDRKAKFDVACGVTEHWTQHDLRRTSRTLFSKCPGVTPDTAERCLGHAILGVRKTYDRHDYLDEKRDAFDKLASLIMHLVHPSANVVPMKKKARK